MTILKEGTNLRAKAGSSPSASLRVRMTILKEVANLRATAGPSLRSG
jgi:hypothetical protein